MYRKDMFKITIPLDNSEEVFTNVYYTEDSIVTYNCQIMGESGTDEGAHTEVNVVDEEITYEDEDGNTVIPSEKDANRGRERAFANTEERAHEKAWEERYEDR